MAQLSRGFGWNPSPANHGHPSFVSLSPRLSLDLPASVDLREHVMSGPGIRDQLGNGACVGESTVGIVETRCVVLGKPVEKRSGLDAYDIARCWERAREYPSGTLPRLTDSGAYPSDCWHAAARHGLATLAVRPDEEATVNSGPYLGAREQGAAFLVSGAYEIAPGSGAGLRIRTALANGIPMQVCSLVDTAFADWTAARNPLGPPDPEKILGGHAMYAAGYELVNGLWVYRVVNSWSLLYGDLGTLLVNEAWIRQASDLFVGDVRIN